MGTQLRIGGGQWTTGAHDVTWAQLATTGVEHVGAQLVTIGVEQTGVETIGVEQTGVETGTEQTGTCAQTGAGAAQTGAAHLGAHGVLHMDPHDVPQDGVQLELHRPRGNMRGRLVEQQPRKRPNNGRRGAQR